MSKIIKLTSENVKRLQAIEITPTGNVVVVGGKNGQGKSSILDSIQYALGGDSATKMPVRRGEEKARIVVDLGDIVVRRTFTAGGGTSLVVTNADGVKQASPQGILDKLTGKLTFDPLDFARQKPEKQSEILRALVGLDFKDLDAKSDALYAERTNVNRDAKALQARMTAMPKHDDAPAVEVSSSDILAEQQIASATNAKNAEMRAALKSAEQAATGFADKVMSLANEITAVEEQIKRLEAARDKAAQTLVIEKQSLASANTKLDRLTAEVSKLKDIDLTPFRERAAKVDQDNIKVRANKARAEVVAAFKAKSEEADELTRKMDALAAERRRKINDAKNPIPGLSFDTAGGVTLDGIPLEQCSSAEQLRVSVSIGLALNPKLKVLLIRDGSLLDDQSMALLLEMAKEADAQIWLERVGVDSATSVVIEDGSVVPSAVEAQ